MALDTYRQEQKKLEEEKEKKENGGEAINVEEESTLTDIIGDRNLSHLFSKMLEHDSDPVANLDLMTRLTKGELEANDVARLEELREEFNERMAEVDNVEKQLTPELIGELVSSNPKFEQISNLLGSEEATAMIQRELREVALINPKDFAKVKSCLDTIEDFRKDGEFATLNKSVEDLCKKEGIKSPDEYLKALAISNYSERTKAIDDLMRKDFGTGYIGSIKRGLDTATAGLFTTGKVDRLALKKEEVDAVFAKLDGHKKELGRVLAGTVGSNDILRKALAHEIMGVKKKPEEVIGMSDARKAMPNDATGLKSWRTHFNRRGGQQTWDQMTGDVQEEEKDRFLQEMAGGATAGKGGFWGKIFGSMFAASVVTFDKNRLN